MNNITVVDPHLTPNLFGSGIHNYVLHLINHKNTSICFSAKGFFSFRKAYLLIKFFLKFGITYCLNFSKNGVFLCFNHPSDWPILFLKNRSSVIHSNDYFYAINKKFFITAVNEINPLFIYGYTDHATHSPYFRSFELKHKVIELPFGFNENRFKFKNKFKRKKMCLLLGAIEKVENLEMTSNHKYFHKHRTTLNSQFNSDVFLYNNFFENYYSQSSIRHNSYDIVRVFNSYDFFFACFSIEQFPSAKIYEGAACGCIPVFISNEHGEYWVNGENCIVVSAPSLDLIKKAMDKLTDDDISAIRSNLLTLAEDFSHKSISSKILDDLKF